MDELFTRYGEPAPAPVQRDEKGKPYCTIRKKCGRCGGQGRSDRWAHTGYVCFDCDGACYIGTTDLKLYTKAEIEVLDARRDKVRAKKQEKIAAAEAKREEEAAARADEFQAEFGDFLRRADRYLVARFGWDEYTDDLSERGKDNFVYDIVRRARRNNAISQGQIDTIESTIATYEAEQARKAATQHLGEVGERLTVKVTVVRVGSYTRSQMIATWLQETVWITTMRTDEGHVLVIKSPSFHHREGKIMTLKATVKDHDEYAGEKQTIVNRPKVAEVHFNPPKTQEEDA